MTTEVCQDGTRTALGYLNASHGLPNERNPADMAENPGPSLALHYCGKSH
jgi:hypothetical protein